MSSRRFKVGTSIPLGRDISAQVAILPTAGDMEAGTRRGVRCPELVNGGEILLEMSWILKDFGVEAPNTGVLTNQKGGGPPCLF